MEKEEIKKSCARLQGQRATNPQCGTIVLIGVKGLLFSKRPSRWYAQISFIESQCNYVPHSKPRFGVQLGTSLGKTSSQNKVSGHLPLENMFIPFASFSHFFGTNAIFFASLSNVCAHRKTLSSSIEASLFLSLFFFGFLKAINAFNAIKAIKAINAIITIKTY